MNQPSKKETTGTEPAASEPNQSTAGTEPLPAMLTAEEAAELLWLSSEEMSRLGADGEVPATKEGGSVRFDRNVILKLRNAQVHHDAPAPGVPEHVSCPFCGLPAYSSGIGDDGAIGYFCRSGKCTWHGYMRGFGVRHQGESAEFERAQNVGQFFEVGVMNYGRRATVIKITYAGKKTVECEHPVTLLEAIAGVG